MDYMTLFPSVSRSLPRFSALAEAILSQVNDLQAVIAAFPSAYSVQYAVGDQLDAIGASFMLPRPEGLEDEPYRLYLLMKLALFTWDGSNESAQRLVRQFLPGASICDNCDGTVTIYSPVSQWIDQGMFPVPAGVRVIVSNQAPSLHEVPDSPESPL